MQAAVTGAETPDVTGGRGAKRVAGWFVIAGLVPAISTKWAQCLHNRGGRDKPGHDQQELPRLLSLLRRGNGLVDFIRKRQMSSFPQNRVPIRQQVFSYRLAEATMATAGARIGDPSGPSMGPP